MECGLYAQPQKDMWLGEVPGHENLLPRVKRDAGCMLQSLRGCLCLTVPEMVLSNADLRLTFHAIFSKVTIFLIHA